ncbi:MAG TPA: AI-2E family transporter [Candidatus Saccharimonadales bacterium]|nr:AI-2E family transporter [Candidatus Saccharimonadales bacterium]
MNDRKFLQAMLALSLIGGAYFLRSYLGLIALAAVTVLLFGPLFDWLLRVLNGRQSAATALTIAAIVVAVAAPVVLVGLASFYQAVTALSDFKQLPGGTTVVSALVERGVSWVNGVASSLPLVGFDLSEQQLANSVRSAVPNLANAALGFVQGLAGSVAGFFTRLIIYLFLVAAILTSRQQLRNLIRKLLPLEDQVTQLYFQRTAAMAKAMIKGTFVIALVQGILGGVFYWIAGVPYPFFFALLLTFLSIIPIGAGIITIPLGIGLLLLGQLWQGLVLLVGHLLVITSVDNVLRPKLVSPEANLPEVLTLLGVFAGLQFFGPLGVIYGPVIMIIITTTIQIYTDYQDVEKPAAEPGHSPKS